MAVYHKAHRMDDQSVAREARRDSFYNKVITSKDLSRAEKEIVLKIRTFSPIQIALMLDHAVVDDDNLTTQEKTAVLKQRGLKPAVIKKLLSY